MGWDKGVSTAQIALSATPQLAGTGFWLNNNYAPITLKADDSAYAGALGGLVQR